MIEIKNSGKSPVQVIIRSKNEVPGSSKSFTCLNIPGIGKGNNTYLLEDELKTDVVDRLVEMGLITTKYIPNYKVNKGE